MYHLAGILQRNALLIVEMSRMPLYRPICCHLFTSWPWCSSLCRLCVCVLRLKHCYAAHGWLSVAWLLLVNYLPLGETGPLQRKWLRFPVSGRPVSSDTEKESVLIINQSSVNRKLFYFKKKKNNLSTLGTTMMDFRGNFSVIYCMFPLI